MIKALLLDLDGTLLQADMDEFLPAYMQRLARAASEFAEPETMIANLMSSTQAMIANPDPTRTLKETFDRRFYPAIGRQQTEMRPAIDGFYGGAYGELRLLTAPVDGARQLVERAQAAGLSIVVATNPLFPQTAIRQRLEWAGFSKGPCPFEFATSYESFHFAKPNPAYYAEILGRLGVPPHQAALIGDDPINDLEPARRLGMAVYHVSVEPGADFPGGPLTAAWEWLQGEAPEETRPEAGNQPVALLARLRGHLAALLHMAADLDAERWVEPPGEREWAPVEILCHLRDTELEVNQPRLRKMLEEESPFLSAADPDRWADERRYRQQEPQAALDGFSQARLETIALLTNLHEGGWQRRGRHAIFGPITLSELMGVAADHDLAHLAQLKEALRGTSS